MRGQWKEVVRLAFKGQRYEDHALDMDALSELSQFQKIITQTASTLWYAANRGRERLPRRFRERTRLCLRKIEEGSAVVPLEVFLEEPEQKELSEPEPSEINEAVAMAQDVYRALERDEPLPANFPRSLVDEYKRWGQTLGEDEAIEVRSAARQPARVTASLRSRLAQLADGSHEDRVDISGEVLEADVRQGRFQTWLDQTTCVTVSFSPEQEEEVTKALRDHRTLRLRVIGRGDFAPEGKLLRVTKVERLELHPVGDVPYDASARPIEDVLAELAAEVPRQDWNSLPADLTDHLDHYLYGTPKQ